LSLTDVAVETPAVPKLIISEVAPWSSGNSPFAADWFEVTNTGNSDVTITGWKMDDNSNAFASAVPLSGVVSINPGRLPDWIVTDGPRYSWPDASVKTRRREALDAPSCSFTGHAIDPSHDDDGRRVRASSVALACARAGVLEWADDDR